MECHRFASWTFAFFLYKSIFRSVHRTKYLLSSDGIFHWTTERKNSTKHQTMGADYFLRLHHLENTHTHEKIRDKICRSIKRLGFRPFRHCWVKYWQILLMSRSYLAFALVCWAAVLLSTSQARSVLDDESEQRQLAHLFRGYRHRFEQSNNFKTLRWTAQSEQIAGLCDLCDIGVPFVTRSIRISFFHTVFRSFRFVCCWIWTTRHWLMKRSVFSVICTYFSTMTFVSVPHTSTWSVRGIHLRLHVDDFRTF